MRIIFACSFRAEYRLLGERDSSVFLFLLHHCHKCLKRNSPLLTSSLVTNPFPFFTLLKSFRTAWVSDSYFFSNWAFPPSSPLSLLCSMIPMVFHPSLIQSTALLFLEHFLLLDFGTMHFPCFLFH